MSQHVKKIYVDSGQIWIGDPCYLEPKFIPTDQWKQFVNSIDFEKRFQEPMGEGLGILSTSGWGDGSYPVEIEMGNGDESNRVRKITITFWEN